MIKIDEFRYQANEGCFIVRKKDGFIMGESIYIGGSDKADDFTDEPYTDESYDKFYESIGMPSPKEHNDKDMDRKRK